MNEKDNEIIFKFGVVPQEQAKASNTILFFHARANVERSISCE
jgi:hypothetical protein